MDAAPEPGHGDVDAVVDMAPPAPVSQEEWKILEKLRWLRGHYQNFTLKIYGQGSPKRGILDMEWSPRVRLSSTDELSLAVED